MVRAPRLAWLLSIVSSIVLVAGVALQADVSTAEDRAKLFDEILAKTLRREAFSPVKNRALGLDVEREMRRFRDEVIAARTDEELYFALMKVSNARKDRHLSISPVPGGLVVDGIHSGDDENYPVVGTTIPHAPVRLAVDYSTPGRYFVFVADRARRTGPAASAQPGFGDKVVTVNGASFDDYVRTVQPYHRYSSINGFWDKLAFWLPQRSPLFPRAVYRDRLSLGLERRDGTRYTVDLPYEDPARLEWEGHGARTYPGFTLAFKTDSFDFYRHGSKTVVLLDWHGFNRSLTADIDRLMAYASEQKLLTHDLIWDGTRSRGGSRGAYAIERLQPKPFKTAFGNLRISDVTQPFIDDVRERFKRRQVNDGGSAETMDGGRWLLDWLEDDVTKGLAAGQGYTNNVPFKLAHAPKYSDGVLGPAKVHFQGRLVCLFGPYGGSHLDQFAAIVADNDLGHSIGMPTGGYSNTWEWEETLKFPISGKPVVQFMWNIGHTIRPNGQILEGEAAVVKEPLLQTRDNYGDYYPQLLARAFASLGQR